MSSKDLIEQLRKATGVGLWTRALLTAADRLEANDTEIATLRELKQAWHDKFWEQSKETNQLRQQLEHWKANWDHEALESESLRQQLAAKQAEVDALMLEYCPSEMSQEQLDNWAAHQRPSEGEQSK